MQDFNEYGRNVLTVKLEKICTYDCVYIYINISVIDVMVDLMWVGAMRLRKEGENLNVAEKFIWDIDTQGSIVKSMMCIFVIQKFRQKCLHQIP